MRERIVLQANMPVGKLHAQSIKKVCAEYQAKAVESILPMLTEEEHAVFKRGRNTSANTIPKHSTAGEYRYATALESLFGYLHLIGERDRCEELFNIIWDLE